MRFLETLSERIRNMHADRLRLALAVIVVALLFWWITVTAGDPSFLWSVIWLLLLALTVLDVQQPIGAIFLVTSAWLWFVGSPSVTTWWALPASGCLLLIHALLALASEGPEIAPVPPVIRAIWRRRVLIVLSLTTLVALIVLTLAVRPGHSLPLSIMGLALLTIGLVLLSRYATVSTRDAESNTSED
ncbi:hypothetical protein [Luteipulveratus mongoliensis]|nr:hypothetical protein [Luteipulveratus mongoliensis]